MVELDFKLDLLGARILVICRVGGLVLWCLLLQVLVLDLDCHEQLNSLMVLVLVSWHEGGLLGGRVRWPLGLLRRGSTTLCKGPRLLLEALVSGGSIVVVF